ncbi:TonB-dependent siderophore receptor [Castellaniella hirudinis]|uniref:TonB-dependent siderophore receptor n=1 Tax=Castellaniella hirudinis TaxID=1144617 RepID=UPI0039C0F3E9
MAVCAAALIAGGLAGMAGAWAQATVLRLDQPAQALDQALNALAARTGMQVVFPTALAEARRAPALQGDYSVPQALDRLLRGSGLEARMTGPNRYTIVRQGEAAAGDAQVLQPVVVRGVLNPVTEGSGSYAAQASNTSTRLNLSIRETPQSVSVITRQRMDDQGMTQLADVVDNTPGLVMPASGNRGSDTSPVYARGFRVENYQIDGVNLVNSGYNGIFQTADMAPYDRVEVIRGANGLMSGVGAPGATINLIRKRPTREFQANASVDTGFWDLYRTEADVSTPLNAAGTVRGRLVAAWQKNGSHLERLEERGKTLYGIVEADLGPDTLATLGFLYQNQDATGHARGGLPLFYKDGGLTDWDRAKSSAAQWAYSRRHNQTWFAALEHRFDSGWKIKGTLEHSTYRYDEVLGYAVGGSVDRATGAGAILYTGRWAGKPEQNALDVYATGPFTLLGREHELVVGATVSRTRDKPSPYQSPDGAGWFAPTLADIYTWDGRTPAEPFNPAVGDIDNQENLTSAYATARFKPTDRLSLIVGARITSWENIKDTEYDDGRSTHLDRHESDKLTPYVGLVYDLSDEWSVYASYTDIFKPQNNQDPDGNYLEPLLGRSYELGAKGELLDGGLNVSAALFRAQQDNFAVVLPGVKTPNGGQAYTAVSGTTTRGIDLEVSGEVLPNWQMAAGFTRALSQDRNGAVLNTNVPQNTFKLFTSYRWPGIGQGLTVGGGVRWQNRAYTERTDPLGAQRTLEQDAYAVVDLMARYQVSRSVSARLNVYNVFDKYYHPDPGSTYYGAPRSFRLGLDLRF